MFGLFDIIFVKTIKGPFYKWLSIFKQEDFKMNFPGSYVFGCGCHLDWSLCKLDTILSGDHLKTIETRFLSETRKGPILN